MNPKPDLPAPDEASARHSRDVARHIASLIDDAGGSIAFAEFMQAALYAPGLGYYAAGARKLGEDGDFVTAPEVSPLFGYVVARQAAHVLRQLERGSILEPGAGTGALAVSVLDRLRSLDALPERYLVLEVSPDLRARQSERFSREIPWFSERVEWIDEIPASWNGVVVANEVADALPVERFRISGGAVLQARVRNAGDGFAWCHEDAPANLVESVRRVEASLGHPLAEGYESEVSLALGPWIRDLCQSLGEGLVVVTDYGLPRREYYAPDRHAGWLRCHFRHRAHDDPLILPGIQDLTAWVDFTTVAEAAVDSDARVAGFTTQAHFLALGGLGNELEQFTDLPQDEQVKLSGAVKRLTLPAEMGENFKCIGLVRGDIDAPPVFREADRTHSL